MMLFYNWNSVEAMLSSREIDQVEVTHMDIFHIFRFSRIRQ